MAKVECNYLSLRTADTMTQRLAAHGGTPGETRGTVHAVWRPYFGVGALAEPATLALVHQFAAPGVHYLMVPVCSFDRDKVLQRLEHIATQVIHPYQRGA